ncbi:MAG TPA: phosphotransferase [Chloroflexota bacterium]
MFPVSANELPEAIVGGVEALVGSRPIAGLRALGGFSIAERWSLELEDGRRVFAKLGITKDLGHRLQAEYRNMLVVPQEFRCQVVGWRGTHPRLLVVEDLSDARWPPPWQPGDVEKVLETMERLWGTPPPTHFPSAEQDRKTLSGWQKIAADPSGFLSLNVGSPDWLKHSLPTLIEAEQAAVLDGDDLIHLDLRSDNLCFTGNRVVLVDWNFACRGNRALDLALWAPSLCLEGGPLPDELLPGHGEYAAAWSGCLAHGAPLPAPTGAPTVRMFQLRQLHVALPWACRVLGLPGADLLLS